MVFIFWSCWHDRTAFFCAEFRDGPIQHVYLVKEIYSWNKEMFVALQIWLYWSVQLAI
jgi:hypothetical protein